MKRVAPTITYYILLITCLLTACVDDKGNYAYHDINAVTISMDTTLTGIVGEQLQITPVLTTPNGDFDAADYSYEWRAISSSADTATVLATTRVLDYTVRLAPGDYTLVFTLTRDGSETFSRATASLSVRTPYSSGYLVLCDDNGRARLDMYSDIKGKTYTDLLAGTTPATWQTPYAIACLPNANAPEAPFYLLTADGTTRLSDTDFAWKEEYLLRYEMGSTADADIRPTTIAVNGPGKMVIAGGKPYYCDNTTGDGLFASARANRYNVANYIGCDALSAHNAPAFLMYDETNGRFVVCAALFSSTDILGATVSGDVTLSTLGNFYGFPVGNSSAFDLPATGRYSLLHMENTRYAPLGDDHGVTYAVLRGGGLQAADKGVATKEPLRGLQAAESNGGTYVYGFAMGDLVSIRYPDKYPYAYARVIYRDLSACTAIADADFYAFSSLKNYLYYVADGTVYRVDMTATTPTAVAQFTLPADETVTCFKFSMPTQSANATAAYDLLIGTVNAAGEGTLRIYDGWACEGDFSGATPRQTLTGFARIKDVLLREVITEY